MGRLRVWGSIVGFGLAALLFAGIQMSAVTWAASPWHLAVRSANAQVGAKATATLNGPPATTFTPVMLIVVDATPIRRSFSKERPGLYRVIVPLLAPGPLTVQAQGPHGRPLASATIQVKDARGSSGYKVLAGGALIGLVLWSWYRNRRWAVKR